MSCLCTAISYSEPKQTWNYVNVRKDAYMFWWLYYTTAVEGHASRPIVIWLQVCSLVILKHIILISSLTKLFQ